MLAVLLRIGERTSSLLEMVRFQFSKEQITSSRRLFTHKDLLCLVKSSSKRLEVKHVHNAVFTCLIRHSRARPHMQKPRVHGTYRRPPIFNLNVDVFRELLDDLDPIDQLCLSATCKLFFDLLWPLMQKWVGWNDHTRSWRKHSREIHHDEIQFLHRSFSWKICSLHVCEIFCPVYSIMQGVKCRTNLDKYQMQDTMK